MQGQRYSSPAVVPSLFRPAQRFRYAESRYEPPHSTEARKRLVDTAHTSLCGAFLYQFHGCSVLFFFPFLYIKTPKGPKIITSEGTLTII